MFGKELNLVAGACVWLAAVGCSGSTEEKRADTGARQVAASFFELVGKSEWNQAYALLSRDSKKDLSSDEFAAAGKRYAARLGFAIEKVHVRSCDEQDARAIAHLTLADKTDSRKQSYKESIVLQQDNDQWHIVLPKTFGR